MDAKLEQLKESARIGAYHAGLLSDLIKDKIEGGKTEFNTNDKNQIKRKITQVQICLDLAKKSLES